MIEKEIYYLFDRSCKIIIFILFFFTVNNSVKIILNRKELSNKKEIIAKKENVILEELPGITFIILHSMCFYYSKTIMTKLVYLYWGPMYFITAFFVVFRYKINWKKIAIPSSIMCKLFYVYFVYFFFSVNLTFPIYTCSVWIMNDQVSLAWFKNNADRTRRLFEDLFIPRTGYFFFLLLPFFDSGFYQRWLCCSMSIIIIIFWLAGIYRLVKLDKFFIQPKIEGFGRDIVYQ